MRETRGPALPNAQLEMRWSSKGLGGAAVAVAALALGTTAAQNAWRARRAHRRYPPTGGFLDIEDVHLHYLERGSGPPLVLLHGNGAMIQDFEISGIPDWLADRFRVVAFDRPGFGLTNRPRSRRWTASAQADLVHQALVRLDVERAIVLGHSWGTLVALSLALDHPRQVQSLVLLAGYYFPTIRADVLALSMPAAPVIGDLLQWTVVPTIARRSQSWIYRRLFSPAPVPARFIADFPFELALRPSQIRASAADTRLTAVSAAALAPRYREMDIPTIILAATDDKIVNFTGQSERLKRTLRDATLLGFEGVGHMIHHTVPEDVIEAVDMAAR